MADGVKKRLLDLGVSSEKILEVTVPEGKEQLIGRFLDVDVIRAGSQKETRGIVTCMTLQQRS